MGKSGSLATNADAGGAGRRPAERSPVRLGGFSAPPRRAVVGGALVALAAIGVFSAHRGSESAPTTRFVVAAREIPAGTTITRDDLGVIAVDLPEDISAIEAEDATGLIGRVAGNDISELEFVSDNDLVSASKFNRPGTFQLAVDMPAARAMQGVIHAGDVVSVMSTDTEGAQTTQLTDQALVHSVSSPSRDSIGASGSVRVVLSVPGQDLATEMVNAAVRSELTLVKGSSSGVKDSLTPTAPAADATQAQGEQP